MVSIIYNRINKGLLIVVTINSMMFIRAKKQKGKTYYWIVESIRIKDKVIQKPLRYIGSAENLLDKLELLDKISK